MAAIVEHDVDLRGLYTSAMLAEIVSVPVASIRRWHRRGWLRPVKEVHRLAYFDFQEISVARRLSELFAAGLAPATLDRKLADLARLMPGVERPLLQLHVVLEGKSLLLRQDDGLVDASGQFRFDFDAVDEESATLPLPLRADDLDSPDELWSKATAAEEAGQLEEAVELYRTILVVTGPRADACFRLAELLYRLQDLGAARERYYMVIELDEEFVEARANLGCVLAETGRLDLAVAAFTGALLMHPEYADVHYHLARTLDELARPMDANEHWRSFLSLAPDSPWAEEARERLAR